jgi:hypothetical protein
MIQTNKMTDTVERDWVAEAMEILFPKNDPENWRKNVTIRSLILNYDPYTMSAEDFCRNLVITYESIKSG